MNASPRRGSAFAAGRRQAREAAMQALFELEQTDHSLDAVLDARMHDTDGDAALEEPFATFARRLVTGAWAQREEIDASIMAAAPQWPISQLPPVDLSILRLAIFELCFDNETPPRAAINEAVELAKAYGGENSGRFVNGVLGSIASQVDRSSDVHGRVDL